MRPSELLRAHAEEEHIIAEALLQPMRAACLARSQPEHDAELLRIIGEHGNRDAVLGLLRRDEQLLERLLTGITRQFSPQ